jgi:hypothetical protein
VNERTGKGGDKLPSPFLCTSNDREEVIQVTNYIKSVARLRIIIDRLVETCAVERLGVIADGRC